MIGFEYYNPAKIVFGEESENSVWLCVVNRTDTERPYSVDCSAAGLGVYSGIAQPISGEIIKLG